MCRDQQFKETTVNSLKFNKIWIEQCEAAEEIKLRYGVQAAFDYLVAEKLLNFAEVATRDPKFARELPRFLARVRGLFTPQDMRTQLDRAGREQREYETCIEQHEESDGEDELILETPAAVAERVRRFATIAELLTAAELGTS
jgi:hypothetical protein